MKYFVMISCGNRNIVPLLNEDDDEVMLFDNEEDALNIAGRNSMAEAFGYEAFKWDGDD